jgi:hypothetical protein
VCQNFDFNTKKICCWPEVGDLELARNSDLTARIKVDDFEISKQSSTYTSRRMRVPFETSSKTRSESGTALNFS